VPVACLGGALWATGNTLSVPVINMIGLSLGLLIWGSANMLMGWASGMFGLVTNGHGDLEHLKSPPLNYAGVALTVIALGMYTQIKPAEQTRAVNYDVGGMNDVLLSNHAATTKQQSVKRMLGIFGAVAAGILFGNTFSPPSWVKANHHGPTNDLDYIFSHFTGIFATSTLWFIVYCVIMRGSPMINNRLTLPAMLSGVMWAIAQTMWFLANTAMSQSVAFPMICSGPGIVSALWGVFAFGEISGARNYVVLCLAILTALTGCIMIGLSKGS
jgi:glucose uptake protein GlcU